MKRRTIASIVTLLMTVLGVDRGAAAGLRLEIEAPPELAAEARRVASIDTGDLESFRQLIGLGERGAAIRLTLVPESSEVARWTPAWVAGYAIAESDSVVLFPHRVPTYPHATLAGLVRHEVAHVLIRRAGGGAELPRWFHEGLAMVAEGSWELNDHSRLALAVLRSPEPEPEDLDRLFRGDRHRVAWAYAVSGAFVRDLLRRHGQEYPARLLAAVRAGVPFEQAFVEATGSGQSDALHGFWRRSAVWYRWIPFITSGTVLWIAITMLALVAIRRRRERDRALHAAWEAEERLERSAPEETLR